MVNYHIIDDIIPKDHQDAIEDYLLGENHPWFYVQNISNVDGHESEFGFNCYYKKLYGIVHPSVYRNIVPIVENTYELLNEEFSDILLARAFMHVGNGESIRNGIHTDLDRPHKVVLYYVNECEGDTVLFDDDDNEIGSIKPKKGSALFFDGSIKHCATSPSVGKRVIINFDVV